MLIILLVNWRERTAGEVVDRFRRNRDLLLTVMEIIRTLRN